MNIPMPNDQLGDRLVVASCYATDEVYLVLALNKEEPYFSVIEVAADDHRIVWNRAFENIVPAVHEYEQRGGDY